MKMTVKLPYVGEYSPRPGYVRLRYRRGGRTFAMKSSPGDPVAQIETEARQIEEAHFGAPKTFAPGSLERVIADYLASTYVPASVATVTSYQRAFAVLTADGGGDVRLEGRA